MRILVRQRENAQRLRSIRHGFTLAELSVSMAIMTILMGAMTSVIVVAGHAIPDSTNPVQKKLAAMEVLDQIAGELFYATSITEETANAVTFTVADRGHGAVGPETIRYAWSGTPGDPLTRQYNGGTIVNVCEDVQSFDLVYEKRVGQLQGPPNVLFLVVDPLSISPQEAERQSAMEKTGMSVQLLPDYASTAEFDAALPNCDVVYVSSEVTTDVSPAIKDSSKGVACEDGNVRVGLGIGNSSVWFSDDEINILTNAHNITAPFATGTLKISDSVQRLMAIWQGVAGGADVLANATSFGYETLVTIEVGDGLYGGGTAAGRRVALPWGDDLFFDFQLLNADAITLMRRSIVWAAAPVVYYSASILIQRVGDSQPLRTEVQVFNTPMVNAP